MYHVIIPAYQPDEKLLQLLQLIKNRLNCHIIVVDDGSTDTAKHILNRATTYATVLHHDTNQGKGKALKTALNYIKKLKITTTIVTADADGQHTVYDIDKVARASIILPSRLVLGVRQFTKDIPLRSRFGNQLTCLLFKLQTGITISDTQTGLRGFHSDLIPFLLNIEGNRYEYEMNMLTKVSQYYQVTEVPIQTVYIDNNASSHFRPIKDGLLIYKHFFKFALSSLAGFLVDYGLYILSMILLNIFPISSRILLANTVARIGSVIVNFNLNRKFVFKSQDRLVYTGSKYIMLAFILFLCDTSLLYLLHQFLALNLYITKIIIGLGSFFTSWFIQKYIIFKKKEECVHEIA